MRIISGAAGRRKIQVPKSVTRPSTDRLREALFSILSQRVEGARVLDLFAGSGALGLECLSRGATSCEMVDSGRESARVIKGNLKFLGLQGGRVIESEVSRFLKTARGPYDLVFADPPYLKKQGDHDFVGELLLNEFLPGMMAAGGLLIVEDPPSNERPEELENGWQLLDQRCYGSCGILFYQLAQGR